MRKTISLICVLTISIIFYTKAQETYSINGRVSDEKGEAVAGATVFLTNSKKATATDGSGKFVLDELQAGNYELVVKMLGFKPGLQSIKLQDVPVNIMIRLQKDNILLKTVSIKSGKPNTRDMRIFIQNFIGTSANAAKCKILNPEVLNFQLTNMQSRLEVSADDFLVIENDALGYKIKYLLKKFIYYFDYAVCYYDGNSYFEELEGTERQKKQWANNRQLAYLGSYRHFFRAAMNNTSRAEGFSVYSKKSFSIVPPLMGKDPNTKAIDIDSTLVTVNQNFKLLIEKPKLSRVKDTIRRQLYIYYTKVPHVQFTWIKQLVDTITIDKNGGTDPGMGFSISGQWAIQRIADLTPLDYFVDPPMIKLNK